MVLAVRHWQAFLVYLPGNFVARLKRATISTANSEAAAQQREKRPMWNERMQSKVRRNSAINNYPIGHPGHLHLQITETVTHSNKISSSDSFVAGEISPHNLTHMIPEDLSLVDYRKILCVTLNVPMVRFAEMSHWSTKQPINLLAPLWAKIFRSCNTSPNRDWNRIFAHKSHRFDYSFERHQGEYYRRSLWLSRQFIQKEHCPM